MGFSGVVLLVTTLAACGGGERRAGGAVDAAAFSGGNAEAPACLVELEKAAASTPRGRAEARSGYAGAKGRLLDARATAGGPSGLEPIAEDNEVAAFGMGCFWGAEVRYGSLPGVERTSVGYAGGRHTGPTYYDIGDHIETVLVEYDPSRVSYRELLEEFWSGHNPGRNPWMNQYRSMIFPVTADQEAIARRALALERDRRTGAVLTEVRPIDRFYRDRSYHDKYYLRRHERLWAAVVDVFGSTETALASTVAARLNALSAGRGSREAVAAALSEAATAGAISPRAEAWLLEMVPDGR